MKRGFSHLYPTANATGDDAEAKTQGPVAAVEAKFASPSVPKNPNAGKTRADFQQTDGISYYKQVCLFVLLEAHVNQGVSHQAIFSTEKQDL